MGPSSQGSGPYKTISSSFQTLGCEPRAGSSVSLSHQPHLRWGSAPSDVAQQVAPGCPLITRNLTATQGRVWMSFSLPPSPPSRPTVAAPLQAAASTTATLLSLLRPCLCRSSWEGEPRLSARNVEHLTRAGLLQHYRLGFPDLWGANELKGGAKDT